MAEKFLEVQERQKIPGVNFSLMRKSESVSEYHWLTDSDLPGIFHSGCAISPRRGTAWSGYAWRCAITRCARPKGCPRTRLSFSETAIGAPGRDRLYLC